MAQSSLAQADLFDDADEDHGLSLRQAWARSAPLRRPRVTRASDPEGAAKILDEHDDYRVLRRLKPRPVDPTYRPGPGERIALVVDVETTGLDHRRDEVIELGMVAFVHDAEGRIGPVVGVLSMLHEPTVEISAEITRLTGITAEMVAGHTIDMAVVRALLEPAELVIAHVAPCNAGRMRGRSARLSATRASAASRGSPTVCRPPLDRRTFGGYPARIASSSSALATIASAPASSSSRRPP